MHIFEAKVC